MGKNDPHNYVFWTKILPSVLITVSCSGFTCVSSLDLFGTAISRSYLDGAGLDYWEKPANKYGEKAYIYNMEQAQVNFNLTTIGKRVEAFVRSRAIRLGSFIVYKENGKIIKEDPRTGQKTVLQPTEKKITNACIIPVAWRQWRM